MAEPELSVPSCQWLDRRMPDKQNLLREVAPREDQRKQNHAMANWRFTAADARATLKRLYTTL